MKVGKDVVKCRWMWWRLGLELMGREGKILREKGRCNGRVRELKEGVGV